MRDSYNCPPEEVLRLQELLAKQVMSQAIMDFLNPPHVLVTDDMLIEGAAIIISLCLREGVPIPDDLIMDLIEFYRSGYRQATEEFIRYRDAK